jgi:hypothetical protein
VLNADTEWWALIDAMRPGDHVLFWKDPSPSSESVVEGFVRAALARNDLIAIALPVAEWNRLAERLAERGILLDRLAAEGHVHALDAGTIGSRSGEPGKRVDAILEELATTARQRGYAGLSILTACAAPAFSEGDVPVAHAVEGSLHRWRRVARTLCVYDARDLYPLRIGDAYQLIRFHTHTLTAYAQGKIVAESVGSNAPAGRPAASRRPRGLAVES